jgi:DNA-directed RNA polymerase specialized sigma24 family protein
MNLTTPDAAPALAPVYLQALPLTHRDGLRHAQAAALLGCSVRAVYYLLPAARRTLGLSYFRVAGHTPTTSQ